MSDLNDPELIGTSISDKPLPKEAQELAKILEREHQQLILKLRDLLNETRRRPQCPRFASAPVTDADFDPTGTDPPRDGVFAVGSDNKLYLRSGGAFIALT